MKRAHIFLPIFATLTMLTFVSGGVAGDGWPSTQPIHLIVPYAAGGNADFVARTTANFMAQALNAQVIVENRSGAGGIIGTQAVIRAPADGNWLCICGIGSISVAPAMESVPYDPLKDLAPVSLINTSPLIMIVNGKSPVSTVAEFIAWAKSKGAGLTYGSSGVGRLMHIAAEVFRNRTGINLIHVPYRGSGLATNALMAGEVDVVFALASDVMSLIQANVFRPIGITTAQRSPYLPDVRTIMEQNVPDYDLTSWIGLFAPTGVPKPIINRLASVMADMAENPETQRIDADFGATAKSNSPEQFAAQLRSEASRWKDYLSGLEVKK